MVNTLRRYNPDGTKVNLTCAVLEHDGSIDKIQIHEAKKQNVRLRGATLPQGVEVTTPSIEWINQLSGSYYQHLLNENSYNFIIGHAPLLSYGATNLRGKRQNSQKVILMVHTLPKTEQGQLDKNLLCSWMRGAYMVFSLGTTESSQLKRFVHGKLHGVYIPIFPIEPIPGTPQVHELQKVTLIVGKKEMGYNGTNVKLAIAATIGAVEPSGRNVELVIFGEEPADEGDLKALFMKLIQSHSTRHDNIRFCFLSSKQKEDSTKKFKACLMESALLLLPLKKNSSVFGLEALTAALTGVPILVSDNSGMATLLQSEDRHSVVNQREDPDSNVRAWEEQIREKISKQGKARDEAMKLRDSLLRSTHIGITHLKLISTITRMLILVCQKI